MTRPREASVAHLLVDCASERGGVAWLEALRAAVRLVRITLDRPLRDDRDEELDTLISSAQDVVVATAEPRAVRSMLEAG